MKPETLIALAAVVVAFTAAAAALMAAEAAASLAGMVGDFQAENSVLRAALTAGGAFRDDGKDIEIRSAYNGADVGSEADDGKRGDPQ